MERILDRLYYSDSLEDSHSGKPTPEQSRHIENYRKKFSKFRGKLEAADHELWLELGELLDQQTVIDLEELPEIYARGFSQGVKLMVEVFACE